MRKPRRDDDRAATGDTWPDWSVNPLMRVGAAVSDRRSLDRMQRSQAIDHLCPSNIRRLPQHGPSTTRLRDSLRNWSCLTWEIIVCGEIRKLAGLIGDPDQQRDDAQTRGRHQFLYLLSAGLTGTLRVRPWAFDAGPPFSTF